MEIEEIATIVVDCGFKIHKKLGPGLLESVYGILMFESLKRRGLKVERQVPIDLIYDDIVIKDAFRVDLIVEGKLIVELKSVEFNLPVHNKQLLTYLRLMDHTLGLLINFGMATFRDGCDRVVNKHTNFKSSRLRVSKTDASRG
ncbi:MAG: hypothetical protein RL367_1710 [Pseudomonadota bacterium]